MHMHGGVLHMHGMHMLRVGTLRGWAFRDAIGGGVGSNYLQGERLRGVPGDRVSAHIGKGINRLQMEER